MVFIDYRDGRPIYEQIAEGYKTLILKGVLKPGEMMPSVRKLAMELSTTPNTVQRAYGELERQGYLDSVKGKGSFVRVDSDQRAQKKRELQDRLRSLLAEAEEVGISGKELLEGMDLADAAASDGWKTSADAAEDAGGADTAGGEKAAGGQTSGGSRRRQS